VSVRVVASTGQLVEKARDPAAPLHEQHAAFAQLVEQSQHLVFGLALASLRNAEEAKDAAQDAFLTAWLRLHQLRDPSAFAAWLKTIVATQCNRRLRRRTRESALVELPESVEADTSRAEYQSLVASAIAALPERERHATVLFYFLGHTQQEIARLLRLKPGTVGKRLHSARLRIRRRLPLSVRREFVRLAPSRRFVEKVQRGLFDEYVGEYRFERRPDLIVSIAREGDFLISEASKQRNVLTSVADESLLTSHYDGEGRFRRNRRGKVTHFVYYEFGRRLGIARKTDSAK
jgi:RNA polymerase sigma-70 factor, ECF subfamily